LPTIKLLSHRRLAYTHPKHDAEARAALETQINRLLSKAATLLSDDEIDSLRTLSARPAMPPVMFERIILYIDDLDRCPPEQVVAVLQAIHLLLAFPLFVVVVAVDTDWVLSALDSHYGELLRDNTKSASPIDFLEKIIQIPYRVRKIRTEGRGSMVRDRLQAFVPKTESSQTSNDSTLLASSTATEASNTGLSADGAIAPQPNAETHSRRHLSLTEQEVGLLVQIDARQKWSPRRRLRFANTYLLIRASMNDEIEADLRHIAILLACADADDIKAAISALCEAIEIPSPSAEESAVLQRLVDRFSFEVTARESDQ
jgi:KAP family P-loop domain